MTTLVHTYFNRAVVTNRIHLNRTNERPPNIGALDHGTLEPRHHLLPGLESPGVVKELEITCEVTSTFVTVLRIVRGEHHRIGTFDLVS
jgi:hypothetical protein